MSCVCDAEHNYTRCSLRVLAAIRWSKNSSDSPVHYLRPEVQLALPSPTALSRTSRGENVRSRSGRGIKAAHRACRRAGTQESRRERIARTEERGGGKERVAGNAALWLAGEHFLVTCLGGASGSRAGRVLLQCCIVSVE